MHPEPRLGGKGEEADEEESEEDVVDEGSEEEVQERVEEEGAEEESKGGKIGQRRLRTRWPGRRGRELRRGGKSGRR